MKERERDEPVLLRETSFTIKTLTHNVYIYFDTHKKTHTRILLLKSNRLSLLLKLKFEFNEYRLPKALAAYQFSVGLDVFVCMRKNSCVLELILATNLPHFCS